MLIIYILKYSSNSSTEFISKISIPILSIALMGKFIILSSYSAGRFLNFFNNCLINSSALPFLIEIIVVDFRIRESLYLYPM